MIAAMCRLSRPNRAARSHSSTTEAVGFLRVFYNHTWCECFVHSASLEVGRRFPSASSDSALRDNVVRSLALSLSFAAGDNRVYKERK